MTGTEITVDEDVKNLIIKAKQDYRVCTACRGPALVPITVKKPKDTDLRIPVGKQTLFISIVQSMYINRVSMDMLYSDKDIFSCPALSQLRDMGVLKDDKSVDAAKETMKEKRKEKELKEADKETKKADHKAAKNKTKKQ